MEVDSFHYIFFSIFVTIYFTHMYMFINQAQTINVKNNTALILQFFSLLLKYVHITVACI